MEETLRQDWTARLKTGEKQALAEFYDTYSPVLLGVCLRYTGIREDAEDVMHESLIKILKGLDKFNPRFSGSFEVWIRRIAVNTSLNFLRDKMKTQNLNGWAVQNTMEPDDVDSLEHELPERMDPETVISLIGQLPAGYRTVLNLYVFENYSHKEIATELGISENTSKSQLSKARVLLKKKLVAFSTEKKLVKDERK
jgi:RNA polymerase sigma-70 factor (ECF subfamily)